MLLSASWAGADPLWTWADPGAAYFGESLVLCFTGSWRIVDGNEGSKLARPLDGLMIEGLTRFNRNFVTHLWLIALGEDPGMGLALKPSVGELIRCLCVGMSSFVSAKDWDIFPPSFPYPRNAYHQRSGAQLLLSNPSILQLEVSHSPKMTVVPSLLHRSGSLSSISARCFEGNTMARRWYFICAVKGMRTGHTRSFDCCPLGWMCVGGAGA